MCKIMSKWDGNWILYKEKLPEDFDTVYVLLESKNHRHMYVDKYIYDENWDNTIEEKIREEYNIVGWHY